MVVGIVVGNGVEAGVGVVIVGVVEGISAALCVWVVVSLGL